MLAQLRTGGSIRGLCARSATALNTSTLLTRKDCFARGPTARISRVSFRLSSGWSRQDCVGCSSDRVDNAGVGARVVDRLPRRLRFGPVLGVGDGAGLG